MKSASRLDWPLEFDYARALLAAVSTHIFSSYSFMIAQNLISGEPVAKAHWMTVAVSLVGALAFAAWFKHGEELATVVPWLILGGFLLVQWICMAVENAGEGWRSTGNLNLFLVFAALLLSWVVWLILRYCLTVQARLHDVLADRAMVEPAPFVKTDLLILFLSTLGLPSGWSAKSGEAKTGGKSAYVEELIAGLPAHADFGDEDSFKSLQSVNWYMPIKAIRAHVVTHPISNPLWVVVIPSADKKTVRDGVSGLIPGSHREVDNFKRLVGRLCRERSWNLEIEVLAEHPKGVDYEDMVALGQAVNAAKTFLRRKNGSSPILIDITGGQATCSAVGAGLSFARGEHVEYVSTLDYEVRQYDLRYEGPELPIGD